MLAFGKSDIGMVRKTNEDSYAVIPPQLFVVADGMGGHAAGEIASKLATDIAGKYVIEHIGAAENPLIVLEQAIHAANKAIFSMSQERHECAGMGTTITMAWVADDTVYWGHVGDSRIYLIHDDHMEQLTSDHSLVGELLSNGEISDDEARVHPHRNVLTRAAGTGDEIRADVGAVKWNSDDMLLLCTDGVTNMVSDEDIFRIISDVRKDGQAAIDKLVDLANSSGGYDNITVILVLHGDG